MNTPETPPTPANVAEMLTRGSSNYHDGNLWYPRLSAEGNVVRIRITPDDQDGNEYPERHFRAVVVEGETTPIVLEEPAELGLTWPDGRDLVTLCRDRCGDIRIGVADADADIVLTPSQAREWAAHLAAMADAAERAQAVPGGDPAGGSPHMPYLKAVAAALETSGIGVDDWYDVSDEILDGYLVLDELDPDGSTRHVGWDETRGWMYAVGPAGGPFDLMWSLPVAHFAAPDEVAAAVQPCTAGDYSAASTDLYQKSDSEVLAHLAAIACLADDERGGEAN